MKRFAAIGLLLLFLLCHAGTYVVYQFMLHRSDRNWVSQERNHIEPARLRTLSVPLTLPYQADQTEYTDLDQRIEWEGITYRAVKGRYARDTFHLVVVIDPSTSNLHRLFGEWTGQVTDAPVQAKGPKFLNTRAGKSDYQISVFLPDQSLFGEDLTHGSSLPADTNKGFPSIPGLPPENAVFLSNA
ncbi:MAG: hypothetical protein R2751_19720 [Bacteroidales bacterium]